MPHFKKSVTTRGKLRHKWNIKTAYISPSRLARLNICRYADMRIAVSNRDHSPEAAVPAGQLKLTAIFFNDPANGG